ALLDGRATYRLARRGNLLELDYRQTMGIRSVAGQAVDVVIEHRCQSAPVPVAPRRVHALSDDGPVGDTPPF
ncbi:MAG: hypothetical protein ACRDQA_01800, partial [Nocardioidaceae bacterium]